MKRIIIGAAVAVFAGACNLAAEDAASSQSALSELGAAAEQFQQRVQEFIGDDASGADTGSLAATQAALTQQVQQEADAFTAAFNAHDAAAAAALWSPEGSYVDADGVEYKGREAIREMYVMLFAECPEAEASVEVSEVRMINLNTATEHGRMTVTWTADEPPTSGRYIATHVKQGDEWVMVNVQDLPEDVIDKYAALADLDWLVGTWQAALSNTILNTAFRWIGTDGFLHRNWHLYLGDVMVKEGVELIGWDPDTQQIASWAFSSDGGLGKSVWTPDEGGWVIATEGTLVDGTPYTATIFMSRVDDDTVNMTSYARSVGDVALPDTPEVTAKRLVESD
jgi:uncharacterized protein (TIGR02246 family)